MTFRLRDAPIQRKLILVILLTSGFALFLMGSALITYEVVTFRHSLTLHVNVLAQIVGANSTAAVAFDDPKSAQETLSALAADRQITEAAIYNQQGQLFASFPALRGTGNFPDAPGLDGYSFEARHLLMFQPILQDGQRLGTLFVRAELNEVYSRLIVYGVLLVFVGACSFLGALLLARTLQRHISAPILALAEVATAVSERQDYSVRAKKHGSDELGQLTSAFNQMLTRIGESNAALAGSEERLRLALEGSQTGTWDWNVLSGQVIWDEYMYPLYGVSKEEFSHTVGGGTKYVHPDDQARVQAATRAALDEKQDLDVGFRIVHPDGTLRHMVSRGRAFYDERGRAVRMAGVSIDVTQSKEAEEELSRAKEAAEAANKAKDNFLAILSHELRTPLTPVLAAVASLQDDESVPEHIVREVDMIRRNVEVEARLIDDLLDLTGVARGKLVLNRRVVDVQPLLEHAMKNYCAGVARSKDLSVSVKITAAETHVLADSSRMTQVFWNLLQNACKFTPAGGAIVISLANELRQKNPGESDRGVSDPDATEFDLVVSVRDTGIGISPENLSSIFDAFEQGERSRTRKFGGLGLGLAISRAIVELHGGTISAQSKGKGQGSTISLRLAAMEAPAATTAQAPEGLPSTSAASSRSLRILLVEDHPDTAEQMTRLLRRTGHHVVCAGSVAEARELTELEAKGTSGCPFDMLISDLGLPDGSGHDLMRELGECHRVPGIALSGFGMKEDVAASLAAGFTRHMTKPVDWQELRAEIEKLAALIPA